jgi:hypothetical protein
MDKCQKSEMVSAKVGLGSFVLRKISPNMREFIHPSSLLSTGRQRIYGAD